MGHIGVNADYVKSASPADADRFAAEADGLAALAATGAVRVPAVRDHGADGTRSWIAMERFDLRRPTPSAAAALGTQMAALHRHFGDAFGWHRDNYVGVTPQPNSPDDDWPRFFAERRLGFQIDHAERNGHGGPLTRRARKLLDRLPEMLDHRPRPSLLHGDFWSGNHGMLPDGTPVIFDPAVHYGDRECDLAMAQLFGGFDNAFFDAYIEAWPMAAGWQRRWKVYQLYHVLNHVNVFGAGYLLQAQGLLDELLERGATT